MFAFYVLVAALLAFVGVRKMKKVRGPERAIAQAEETKQILRPRPRTVSGAGPAASGVGATPSRPRYAAQPWVETVRDASRPAAAADATCCADNA